MGGDALPRDPGDIPGAKHSPDVQHGSLRSASSLARKKPLDLRSRINQSFAPIMMKCYEIFSKLSPELTNEIFEYLLESEKAVYKAIIQNVATRRKLRPIFIERKPRNERHTWLQQALSTKGAADLTTQLFQIWLLGAQREMICEFLDSLGIAHDGKGVVENLPPEPSREDLSEKVSKLLEKHRPEVVAVYLHAFQAIDETGWSALNDLLANDPRLALGEESQK
jgi:hypothetical protein